MSPGGSKRCICHITKWRIHPFNLKNTVYNAFLPRQSLTERCMDPMESVIGCSLSYVTGAVQAGSFTPPEPHVHRRWHAFHGLMSDRPVPNNHLVMRHGILHNFKNPNKPLCLKTLFYQQNNPLKMHNAKHFSLLASSWQVRHRSG